jgi:flagellar biosynthesis protein FlhB
LSEAHVVHAIEGRLRIRLRRIKNDPAGAEAVSSRMRAVDGVRRVAANPLTATITITYDRSIVSAPVLIGKLSDVIGVAVSAAMTGTPSVHARALANVGHRASQAMLKKVLEAAVQRALLSLI